MSKKIVIVGAGGLGRETVALIRQINAQNPVWDPVGFLDDQKPIGQLVGGLPILGRTSETVPSGEHWYVLAIGDPRIKENLIARFQGNIHFGTLIHPTVVVAEASSVSIGQGCILAAGAKITTEISIGNHVLINLNVTIGHNSTLGDCSSIMPGANIAGDIKIGTAVLIGSGAAIINRSVIGDRAKVGAGAVVMDPVPADATAVGVPAKVIPK